MAAKQKFNPRKLMELAIEVMNQSLHEPRDDGKSPPKVGAVLYKPDGSIETAYRGELRWGDHAEFALLERKNRHNRLDGAKLFATLEPCAPGARKPPKLACAERIVNARIKEVWVGIEDPDPLVDRKGIKFLQKHGVTVTMFDRDLQEIIKAENKEFIKQAMERAAASEDETETVALSPLENPVAHTDLADFSSDALEQYRTIAGIKEAVGSVVFNRRLVQQGLLQLKGKKFAPSGFGLLLFGKSPRDVMPQAGMLGTIHHADGTEDKPRNFDGPQVLVPEQALQWLRDKLPNPIDRSEARRQEANRFFFALVREGIVNALVHRDYSITGAKCQLIVTPDTVVIKSPGEPVEPITLKQLQDFNAPMLSRNPTLHYVFGKLELAEERGLGLKTMRESATDAGLPLPKYTWEAPYLVLTLYRSMASALKTLASNTLASLSKAEQAGWQWLTTKQTVTSGEYAAAMNLPERTALNHLKRFTELGLLLKVGSGRATEYQVHQSFQK